MGLRLDLCCYTLHVCENAQHNVFRGATAVAAARESAMLRGSLDNAADMCKRESQLQSVFLFTRVVLWFLRF